jgi:hypothetical protein
MAEQISINERDLDIFKRASELIDKRVSDFKKDVVASVATVAGLAKATSFIAENLDTISRALGLGALTTGQREAAGGFVPGIAAALFPAEAAAAFIPGPAGIAVGAGILLAGGITGAVTAVGETRRAREEQARTRALSALITQIIQRKETADRIKKLGNLGRIRAQEVEALLRRMRRGS